MSLFVQKTSNAHSPFKILICFQELSKVPEVDWNIQDRDGDSPMTWAVKTGCEDVLRILLTIPSINYDIRDELNRNLAQIAVESDKESSLQCLELLCQDSRVNWNIRNSYGDTPIMHVWKYRKSMLNILMKVKNIDYQMILDNFIC